MMLIWADRKSFSNQEKSHKNLGLVDIAKFVCAILVVCIHTHPLKDVSPLLDYGLVQYVSRLAVPYYFVAAGYFLFRKTSPNEFDSKVPICYAIRMLKLYVIWSIIYLPLSIIEIVNDEDGSLHGVLAWVRNAIMTGSYSHLWFLKSMAVAVLILTFLFNKKCPLKRILILAGFFYALGLLGGQTYTGLLSPLKSYSSIWTLLKIVQKIIVTTRNGVFEGFIFVGIGMLMAYKPIWLTFNSAMGGFAISMILLLGEAIFVQYIGLAEMHELYVFLVPAVSFLFYITTHIELKEKKIYGYLRKMSTLIYFTHLYPIKIVEIVGNNLESYTNGISNNSLVQFFCVTIFTVMISYAIVRMGNQHRFQWIKKIYT